MGRHSRRCNCCGGTSVKRTYCLEHRHVQSLIARVWRLYMRNEKEPTPVALAEYTEYRALAVKAIKAGPPEWKEEFRLP